MNTYNVQLDACAHWMSLFNTEHFEKIILDGQIQLEKGIVLSYYG